ncbi:serine/threonine-protein phosphatase 7 long form homolog [Coffea arabica]|uniref:Serine/threonine-protein phosphatase 7 long form homolog n=1 Tax=Coffea arabica TaxID=13443 RepID=A0ABM4UFN4_COFAR
MHTFHLPVGEATVTLQDVEVLWGLHIDGPSIIGVDTYCSIQEWGAICEELIGFSPAVGYFDGQRLKLGCLARVLDTELPPDASDAECSWGSACLATLYRSLCDATHPAKSAIAGPLVLLQNNDLDVHRLVRHVVPAFRDQLTGLRPEEFIWQPYSEDVLASLPTYYTAGRDIWRSVTYLICWDVVESHLPHRVMRQFGFHQSLPDMRLTDNQAALHFLDRRSRANQDWTTTHR